MSQRFPLPRLALAVTLLGASAIVAGCEVESTEGHGVTDDDLLTVNGLTMINGLTMTNGLSLNNGLTMTNGLSTTTGLASSTGLMTTGAGRTTVAYMVRCALPAGHSITKKDQNGTSYIFAGQIGVAAGWESGACDTACQEAVSACLMAHINVAGVHVPLWLDSPIAAIGFGSNSGYPNEEGTFFGNLFVTGSNGKVAGYYCEGAGFASGVVPGRLGATASAAGIFTNPFGTGALCASKCSAAPSSSKGQGYSSCNGYHAPVTVWRAASYRPVFDPTYVYRLINSQSKLAMDVKAKSTADGAIVDQYNANTGTNQEFQIVPTASSTWKIIAVHSGKAMVGTGTSKASGVVQKTFANIDADLWGIDDHNGHFKLINKASANALEVPSGNKTLMTQVETSVYTGASNQDWDIYAVVP